MPLLLKRWARENRGFLLFMFLMVVFRSAVADWNHVPTGSMKPTILEGDRILVEKMAYDLRLPLTPVSLYRRADPQRGDIVVFDSHAADERLVKRVIGVPGDVVEMDDNRLYLNGELVSSACREGPVCLGHERLDGHEHALRFVPPQPAPRRSFGPVVVPEGQYLVLGDNRDESGDSRYIGWVPRGEMVGRVRRVVISFDRDRLYVPRAGRFFQKLDS